MRDDPGARLGVFLQPNSRRISHARASGKTSLHEVTAGRRFPIDHFPRNKTPGETPQHQVLIELAPSHTTRR